MTRGRRLLRAVAVALVAAPVAYLVVLNGLLNVAVPLVLSRNPGRLRVSWDLAWMWVPGEVAWVRGLRVVGQGPSRAFDIRAADASGHVDLGALRDHHVVVSQLRASGISFSSQRRDGPPRRRGWKVSVTGHAEGRLVEIDGVVLSGEIIGDGELHLSDDLALDVDAAVNRADVHTDGVLVASDLGGKVNAAIDGWPLGVPLGRDAFAYVSGEAQLGSEIESLSFLAPYLERAPWLSIVGTGHLVADVTLDRGQLTDGSAVDARTRDLVVRFQGYDITGDGIVHAEVLESLGMPESQIDVRFGAFTIGERGVDPFLQGEGFTVTGISPHVSLAEPFETVDLTLDLPQSRVPELSSLDVFLPTDLGLRFTGGRASLEGRLMASTRDGIATGEAVLDGDDITAMFGDLGLTFDLGLRLPLREGRLADRVYDFSGATASLADVGIREPEAERRAWWSDDRSWWALVSIPDGRALGGRAEYLDATITLDAADSTAFVRLLSQRKPLPDWLLEALHVQNVHGSGHLRVGTGHMTLSPLELSAGRHYTVGMRWRRRGREDTGELFAAWRSLSVGLRFDGEVRELVPFGARAWFAEGAEPDDEVETAAPAVEEPAPDRRPVIRWTRRGNRGGKAKSEPDVEEEEESP